MKFWPFRKKVPTIQISRGSIAALPLLLECCIETIRLEGQGYIEIKATAEGQPWIAKVQRAVDAMAIDSQVVVWQQVGVRARFFVVK